MKQNAPVIYRREAVVYELLRKGVRPHTIASEHGEPSIYRILRQLQKKKFVLRGERGQYQTLISQYQVIEDTVAARPRKERNSLPAEPYRNVTLSGSERDFLQQNRYLNRSEIAKVLKKPRYVICRELISLFSEETS